MNSATTTAPVIISSVRSLAYSGECCNVCRNFGAEENRVRTDEMSEHAELHRKQFARLSSSSSRYCASQVFRTCFPDYYHAGHRNNVTTTPVLDTARNAGNVRFDDKRDLNPLSGEHQQRSTSTTTITMLSAECKCGQMVEEISQNAFLCIKNGLFCQLCNTVVKISSTMGILEHVTSRHVSIPKYFEGSRSLDQQTDPIVAGNLAIVSERWLQYKIPNDDFWPAVENMLLACFMEDVEPMDQQGYSSMYESPASPVVDRDSEEQLTLYPESTGLVTQTPMAGTLQKASLLPGEESMGLAPLYPESTRLLTPMPVTSAAATKQRNGHFSSDGTDDGVVFEDPIQVVSKDKLPQAPSTSSLEEESYVQRGVITSPKPELRRAATNPVKIMHHQPQVAPRVAKKRICWGDEEEEKTELAPNKPGTPPRKAQKGPKKARTLSLPAEQVDKTLCTNRESANDSRKDGSDSSRPCSNRQSLAARHSIATVESASAINASTPPRPNPVNRKTDIRQSTTAAPDPRKQPSRRGKEDPPRRDPPRNVVTTTTTTHRSTANPPSKKVVAASNVQQPQQQHHQPNHGAAAANKKKNFLQQPPKSGENELKKVRQLPLDDLFVITGNRFKCTRCDAIFANACSASAHALEKYGMILTLPKQMLSKTNSTPLPQQQHQQDPGRKERAHSGSSSSCWRQNSTTKTIEAQPLNLPQGKRKYYQRRMTSAAEQISGKSRISN